MPTKCSINGCENYYSKGVPFYDVPSPLKYKFSSEKADLSKKRRKLWLDAMGIKNDTSEILRICSKHFVTGKPATLENSHDVDWVPTIHMKLGSASVKKHKTQNEDATKPRKDSNKTPKSSKENVITPKYSKSTRKHIHKDTRTGGKVRKKESTNIVKKIDLKKFLNCKVLLDGNIQCTTFRGTNGSGLTIAQKHGNFTADSVMVKETAINNTVLRIHLVREDLHDLMRKYKKLHNSPKRKKRKEEIVSSFGRKIKRKSHFFEDSVTPQRKSSVDKTIEILRNSVSSTGRTEKQMKNRNNKDKNANENINNNHQLGQKVEKSSSKTLNRSIKKSYRDKIKIKLFPNSSSIEKALNNGTVNNINAERSLKFKRQILFVKNQYKSSVSEKTYFLKFSPYRSPEDGILDYSFQKLVTDVKHMKLPAPSWKIKVNIKQGKISAVTFTNKLALERSVGFSANSDKFKVTIDSKPAFLLGCPDRVRTSEDLEILLDIIQNINSENPMILYK